MEGFVRGDLVVVPFPFSDLTRAKRQPALVLANLDGDDLILCQITSQSVRDQYAIPLTDPDFRTGSLKRRSNVRPNRVFTADRTIILYKVAALAERKMDLVIDKLVEILKRP